MKRLHNGFAVRRALLSAALLAFGLCCVPSLALAQTGPSNFKLRLSGGIVPFQGTIESEVRLDNFVPVSAWNYFVSYCDYRLSLLSLDSGPGLATISFGGPPEFELLQLIGNETYQHAVVIGSGPPAETIPAGLNQLLSVATYTPGATLTGPTTVRFPSSAGSTVSNASQQAFPPITTDAEILIVDSLAADYRLFFGARTLETGNNEVRVLLNSSGAPLSGWSYGASYGESPLIVEMVETGAAALIANGGNPPDFEALDWNDFGFTQSVVVSTIGGGLPPGIDLELAVATIFAPPGFEGEYTIRFIPFLGIPVLVVPNLGVSLTPTTSTACLTTNHSFDRGDCNDDGTFSLADVIFGLEVTFMGESPQCHDACDSNNNEQIDVADPVYSLNALFNGGPPPPGSGNCTMDPNPLDFGGVACLESSACP